MPVRRTPKGTATMGSTGTRMLPPPYEGPRGVSGLPSGPREASQVTDTSQGRTVSPASTSSHQSSLGKKKPAPPIPKKPELLSSNSIQDVGSGNTADRRGSAAQRNGSPSVSSLRASNGGRQTPSPKPAPPPSRRTGSRLDTTRESSPAQRTEAPPPLPGRKPSGLQQDSSDVGPPLPRRRPTGSGGLGAGLLDGDDEEASKMSSWQPLQPQ
jgi:hypothetical protein